MEKTIAATYVSTWAGQEIETACTYDPRTRTAFDIATADHQPESDSLDGEAVILPDGTRITSFTDGDRDVKIIDGRPE